MKRSVTEQRNRLAIIARAAREVLLAFDAYAPDEPMGPRMREGLAAKLHAAFQEADVSMADLEPTTVIRPVPCPNCNGRGEIRERGIFPQTVGCEDCAGTGRVL